MRHRKAGRKFNRNSSHRKAMFRNMAKSLIVHGRIRTTEKRAKELRGFVERLVRFALKNDVPARREAYKVLGSHALVKQLFDEIGPRFVGVPGGFTRVLKLGTPRAGDAAPMAIIEFSRTGDEAPVEEKPKTEAPKKAAAPKKEAPKVEEKPVEEAPAEEAPAEEAPAEEATEETEEKAE